MHPITSLEQISEGIHAPSLDVVVVRMDHVREAPEALRRLRIKEETEEWMVVNLMQLKEAAAVAGLLVTAEGGISKLGRALQGMLAASQAVERVSASMGQHWEHKVRTIGTRAGLLVRAGAVGRLDAADEDFRVLLEAVASVRGRPSEAVAIGTAHPRPRPPIGWEEDRLLREMEACLLTLRDVSAKVKRRLHRLHMAAGSIRQFHDEGVRARELGHQLSRPDPQFVQMAARVLHSINQLLGRLAAADAEPVSLADIHESLVRQQLEMPLLLNHARFTDPMEVRSLRDLDAAVAAWRPHRGAIINISGVNICSDASNLKERVAAGVEERGWIAHGMNALTDAQQLDALLATISEGLNRLSNLKLMTPLGDLLEPQAFHEIVDDLVTENIQIQSLLHDKRRLVSAEGLLLAMELQNIIDIARSDDDRSYKLWEDATAAVRKINAIRSSELLFR